MRYSAVASSGAPSTSCRHCSRLRRQYSRSAPDIRACRSCGSPDSMGTLRRRRRGRRPPAAPTRHARQGRCLAGPTDARTCGSGTRCRRVSGNRSPSWADPTAPSASPLPCSVRLVCRPGRARSLRRTGRVCDARGGPVCRAVSRSTVTHMSLSTTPAQSALTVISLGRQRRGRPREGPGPPVGCHM